jgi:hypothetical protein
MVMDMFTLRGYMVERGKGGEGRGRVHLTGVSLGALAAHLVDVKDVAGDGVDAVVAKGAHPHLQPDDAVEEVHEGAEQEDVAQ